MVLRMQKPPYDVSKRPGRTGILKFCYFLYHRNGGREDTWKELLPELMWVCNEAARRQAVSKNRGAGAPRQAHGADSAIA